MTLAPFSARAAIVIAALCLSLTTVPQARACTGDLTGDGSVSVSDLLELLAVWGPCEGQCNADLNGDGNVDVSDLLELLANWGDCPGIPTVYIELNSIDPEGNDCPEGLCTNGTPGIHFLKSTDSGLFYTPGTVWTQSRDAKLVELRTIVHGIVDTQTQAPKYGWDDDLHMHAYTVEIWGSVNAYFSSPEQGTYFVSGNKAPINDNHSEPIGYTHSYSVGGVLPNYEWIFSLEDDDVYLEEGNTYVIALRATGSADRSGYPARSISTYPLEFPGVMKVPTLIPNWMDQHPYNYPAPQEGTTLTMEEVK